MTAHDSQRTPDAGSVRSTAVASMRHWLFTPPRAHGQLEEHRTVSFLELFYDLVFVVLVAQVAHTLAGHLTWTGILDFTTVFGLIWIAWLNGSLYQDLHGGDDGLSRRYVFGQMFLLTILAVYAGHATSEDGLPFAVVYVILTCYLAYQWWRVRSVDENPRDRATVRSYVLQLLALAGVIAVSTVLPPEYRTWVWFATVVVWSGITLLAFRLARSRVDAPAVMMGTESMAERFGLLTILVLGEVVVGIVNGLIEAERTTLAIVTGMLALNIGFGFWWNYFDSIGRRLPRQDAQEIWVFAQLPLQASIAAAGAGMISLVEHSAEAHTPAPTAWLLAGASASMLVWLAVLVHTIDYDRARTAMRTKMIGAYLLGAAASLAIGWWAPAPWLLALALGVVHMAVWGYRLVLWAFTSARYGTAATGLQG